MAALAALALAAAVWWGLRHGVPVAPPAPADTTSEPAKGLKPLSDNQLERMVAQATERTTQDPKDKVAWAMLAHSYEMLGQFREATQAYAKLLALAPDDANVLADYADALGVANGRSLVGEPAALVERALAVDGKHVKALMLGGALAAEQGDPAKAISFWQRARAASADPALNRRIDQNLAQAQAALASAAPASGAATAVAALRPASASAAASAPRLVQGPAKVSGRVWLAASLQAKAPPEATVFIFARPADGSRMPVALLRKQLKDLPFEFTLDESMAMTKSVSLANVSAVVVVARVSMRGDVTPQAGDLQGLSAPVPVGTAGIKLEISEVLK